MACLERWQAREAKPQKTRPSVANKAVRVQGPDKASSLFGNRR